MKHSKGYISRTLSFLGCICVAGLCLFLLKEFSTNPSSDRGNRKLSFKSFCDGVVQPLSAAIENQYASPLDFFTQNDLEEGSTNIEGDEGDKEDEENEEDEEDDIYYTRSIETMADGSEAPMPPNKTLEGDESTRFSTECTKSDYKEFSIPSGGLLPWYQVHYLFHAYTQCRGKMKAYGSAHEESTWPYTWPQDTGISVGKDNWKYVHVSCCSDKSICENIKNDFNIDSECWIPNNLNLRRYSWWLFVRNMPYRVLDPFLCTETRSFTFNLTQEGLELSTGEHSEILEEYVWCSSKYSNDDQPVFVVEKDIELSVLNVTCSACNDTSTPASCLDMETKFLARTLCTEESNAKYYSDYAILVPDVEACKLEDVSSYNETLTLPAVYFPGESESEIQSELEGFLKCRLSAGVYTNLTREDFPTLEKKSVSNSELVSVLCKDKCSNGVICKDIDVQFNNELRCVTKHKCSPGWFHSYETDYDLEFLDGTPFEGSSRQYKKDVELKMEKNLNEYISCRFGFGDNRYDHNGYYIHGWTEGNKFYAICFNWCGTIPYCDAIRTQMSLDPKDDSCYEQEISVDKGLEDSRVETIYEYNFHYDDTETFNYDVQSLVVNPLQRAYFGDQGVDSKNQITPASYTVQGNAVEDLMKNFGYEDDNKISDYSDVCQTLGEYVKCDDSKTVVKIDVERKDEGDFEIDKIKLKFGSALVELILGADLPRSTTFSTAFFELTNLDTLTLRARGKLNGNLHSSIGNMNKLKVLDLNQCPMILNHHQGLTGGIPTEIKNAPLETLDVGCNRLSGNLPKEFFQNHFLGYAIPKKYNFINLNDNNFSGKLLDDLDELEILTQLSLARNKFTGTVPITSSMKKLRLIDLQHNRIENENENENVCTSGTAAEKGFTGNLPDILFTVGSTVEVAALNNNCFSGEITGKIRFSTQLQYLDLRNNDLRGTLPRQLSQCTQLKVLLLDGNPNLDLAATPNSLKRKLRDNQVKIDVDLGEVCDKNQRNTCIDD